MTTVNGDVIDDEVVDLIDVGEDETDDASMSQQSTSRTVVPKHIVLDIKRCDATRGVGSAVGEDDDLWREDDTHVIDDELDADEPSNDEFDKWLLAGAAPAFDQPHRHFVARLDERGEHDDDNDGANDDVVNDIEDGEIVDQRDAAPGDVDIVDRHRVDQSTELGEDEDDNGDLDAVDELDTSGGDDGASEAEVDLFSDVDLDREAEQLNVRARHVIDPLSRNAEARTVANGTDVADVGDDVGQARRPTPARRTPTAALPTNRRRWPLVLGALAAAFWAGVGFELLREGNQQVVLPTPTTSVRFVDPPSTLTTTSGAASLPPVSVDAPVATTAVADTTAATTSATTPGTATATTPTAVAAVPTTIDGAAPRTLPLSGRMVFSYITFQSNEYPLAKTMTLAGPCDGRGSCSITPPFTVTPYEGQPATYDLKLSDGGYTLTTRFNHVEPGAACAPISTKVQLTMSIVGGPNGRGVLGSGQYVPDRRSTPLPDGSKGCTTDVGVFTFASQGLTPPPLPAPAPPPPG